MDNVSIASLLTINCTHLASGGSPRALRGATWYVASRWGYPAISEIAPDGRLYTPSIPLLHENARTIAYVRWTTLTPATYCSCDSHVGLVHYGDGGSPSIFVREIAATISCELGMPLRDDFATDGHACAFPQNAEDVSSRSPLTRLGSTNLNATVLHQST